MTTASIRVGLHDVIGEVHPHVYGHFIEHLNECIYHGMWADLLQNRTFAIIDGANRLQIFWWIIVPLSRSALAALAIFVFLASWNDFLWPFVATNDRAMRTLPVGLTIFNGEYITERGLVMAGAAISSVPVLIVYAFFQQHIIKSLALTGLKG